MGCTEVGDTHIVLASDGISLLLLAMNFIHSRKTTKKGKKGLGTYSRSIATDIIVAPFCAEAATV